MSRVSLFLDRSAGRVATWALVPILAIGAASSNPAHGVGSSGLGNTSAAVVVEPSPFVDASTVRLITGDLVRVLTRADGSSMATVLRGSPHAGGPLVRWRSGTSSYVSPRTSGPVRRRLDLSLFDVGALARHGDRVPVVVRFVPGATVHRVPGLRLNPATARSTSTSTMVRGSDGPAFGGPRPARATDVTSIRLAGSRPRPSRSTAPTHQLVVGVVGAHGLPVSGVVVTLFNVGDGSTFQDTTGDDGQVGFEVQSGHYSALGFSFSRLVIAPEFDVTADQTVGLDLRDATVKPRVTMAGYRVVDTALSVDREPQAVSRSR